MNAEDYATETKERAVTVEVDGQPATTQIKLKTVLTAQELMQRAMEALLIAGHNPLDQQGLQLAAARQLAAEASSRGHREVGEDYLRRVAENQRIHAEVEGTAPKLITDYPLAQQYEGVADAAPEAPNTAFQATTDAARASMRRAGQHEPDRLSEWSGRALMDAVAAHKNAGIRDERARDRLIAAETEERTEPNVDWAAVESDLRGIRGVDVHRANRACAVLRGMKCSASDRRWVKRHEWEIEPILRRHVTIIYRNARGTVVKVASKDFPAGSYVLLGNLKLFY